MRFALEVLALTILLTIGGFVMSQLDDTSAVITSVFNTGGINENK